MCGIAGIIHFNSITDSPNRVSAMTNALVHRGPDAEGYYNDSSISLGHRRLSIIDLSAAANQPFFDPLGKYVLIYNGELYNYQQLKKEINDYPYQTTSDTEVIMAAFSKWGINCLEKLDGMFAFAIWDIKEEVLWLVRDRLGVKPLYYFHDSTGFAFSSEKRSLLKSGLIMPEIDHQSLFTYLTFQSTGYPNSIIKEIHQIDPGTYLKVSKNAVEVKTYWDITHFHQNEIEDSKQVRKHVFNLLLDAVQKRRSSDVELGVFLSGGIDSSAIVGLMSLGSNQHINTFHLANTKKEYDESGYAESIAKRFSTSHSKILLNTDEILSKVTDGLKAMDSPTADGINTYLISSAMRSTGLKVALSGIGGDELFVGYPGFAQYYNANKLRNAFRDSYALRKPLSYLLSSLGSGKTTRLGRMLAFKNPSIDLVYPILREILPPKLIRNFIKSETDASILGQFLSTKSTALKSFELYSQYSIAEYLGYSQKTLLKDTDQMSMAVGLEIREPFFDYKMIEYVLALPDHFKYPTSPKRLLVESVYPILPQEIANRSKQGFLLPWKSWMQNELFTLCDFHIRNFSERDYVHAKPLLEYWHRFLKNDPNIRWMELWQIVVLDFWLQKNLD